MKSKNKDRRKLSNIEFLIIFLMIVSFIFSLLGGILWNRVSSDNAIVSVGWQETATFIRIKSWDGGIGSNYFGVYKFIDEDGTVYQNDVGVSGGNRYIEEITDAVVGTKIVITIDGKGNCTSATEIESMAGPIVYVVLVPMSFLAITAAFVLVFTKKKKKWVLAAPERKEEALQLEHEELLKKRKDRKNNIKAEKQQMLEDNKQRRDKILKEKDRQRKKSKTK